MSHIPEAEYQAIRQSWRNALRNPEKWTNGQMAAACLRNIDEAAKRESRLRHEYDRLPPGDPRLKGDKHTPGMLDRIHTAKSDQAHWRLELKFWRGRCAAEGDGALPQIGFAADRPVTLPPDPRLPREPGDDSEEGVSV